MVVKNQYSDEKDRERKPEKESELEKAARSYSSGWAYAEYAFQYGVAIIVCSLLGYWLDKWLNTGNVFFISGMIFGAVGGFVILLRSLGVIRYGNANDKKHDDSKPKN